MCVISVSISAYIISVASVRAHQHRARIVSIIGIIISLVSASVQMYAQYRMPIISLYREEEAEARVASADQRIRRRVSLERKFERMRLHASHQHHRNSVAQAARRG